MAAHAKSEAKRRRWPWVVGLLTVALLAGGGALSYALTRDAGASNGTPSGGSATPTTSNLPFAVASTNPAAGAQVSPADELSVSFTQALSSTSPLPVLTPEIPGQWQRSSPSSLRFVATSPIVPGTAINLRVPAGTDGVRAASGARLAADASIDFSIAPGSTLLLQQLLAEAGYLPLSFTASTATPTTSQVAVTRAGRFTWRFKDLPESLTKLWVEGEPNVIMKGALMRFQDQQKLTADGSAGPDTWAKLTDFVAKGQYNPDPYNYVTVQLAKPQTVRVYSNGKQAYQALANTGVPGADTRLGTFPVYLRYLTQTMRGTNPDGSTYVDPGIPWISYFDGGEALHGFPRPGYGYPQSNGCVELTEPDAKAIWPMTPIGTLVTVF